MHFRYLIAARTHFPRFMVVNPGSHLQVYNRRLAIPEKPIGLEFSPGTKAMAHLNVQEPKKQQLILTVYHHALRIPRSGINLQKIKTYRWIRSLSWFDLEVSEWIWRCSWWIRWSRSDSRRRSPCSVRIRWDWSGIFLLWEPANGINTSMPPRVVGRNAIPEMVSIIPILYGKEDADSWLGL